LLISVVPEAREDACVIRRYGGRISYAGEEEGVSGTCRVADASAGTDEVEVLVFDLLDSRDGDTLRWDD
jgi:hypothetical protein